MEHYIHPGRTPFVEAAAARLGLADTETNHQPVGKIPPRLKDVEHFVSQACADEFAGKPETQAELLSHVEPAVMSLKATFGAAVDMVRSAYDGLGLEIPGWLSAELGLPVIPSAASEPEKPTRNRRKASEPEKPEHGEAQGQG